jgi:hypothetical protein
VALAVVALAIISGIHLEISPDEDLIFFIFFGTITGYNFIKYAGVAGLHHRSLTKNLRLIQIFSFLCFVGLLIFAFRIRLEVIAVAVLLGFLTLLYALPFFGERNLRTIGGIKIYIIALIWAGVTVFLPVINSGLSVDANVFLEFFQIFLFVLVLLIPFEIRDLKYDRAELKTLPQNIGIRGSKLIGVIFLILMLVLEFLKSGGTPESLGALGMVIVVTGFIMIEAEEEQSTYFSSFWVEGLPVLWLGILLLLENFF